MKRYTIIFNADGFGAYYDVHQQKDGEWVKHSDAEAMIRELTDALSECKIQLEHLLKLYKMNVGKLTTEETLNYITRVLNGNKDSEV